jgi:uridine phosphorylase
MPPAEFGDFVVADGGLPRRGTSGTYAPLGYPAIADFDLGVVLRAAPAQRARRRRAGLFGTYDEAKIDAADLAKGERELFEVALDAAVAPLPPNSWTSP